MVYFISHVVLLENRWIPLTNVPVHLVNLDTDKSNRKINTVTHSIQFVWQPGRFMKPMFPVVIKTCYIIKIQKQFKKYLKKRSLLTLPKNIFNREIGL